ncbi:MAG TPA: pilus assembly protein PilM [Phycisphaerae bacterium]|nr:pilus assembly protein PilM [Phycisphaerae bacterium]HUU21024.1 pilus assembly protein PilM [Phycisphaerae bacterium]
MGLEIKTLRNLPIGVDLGTTSVKMAQVRMSKSNVELIGAAFAESIPPQADRPVDRVAAQLKAVAGLLKSGGFSGQKAILSLPAEMVLVQPIKVPIVPPGELDAVVRHEVQPNLPCPADQAVIRHILAGTVRTGGKEMQERIVVAVPRADLERCLELARHAGLEVVGVNVEACAVVECFARLFRRAADESRVTLFIDLGWGSTQVVLAHGSKLVFARNLPVGGCTMDRAVAEVLQIPLDQAHEIHMRMIGQEQEGPAADDLFRLLDTRIAEVTDKIAECLRYYESIFVNRAIDRIIFVGGQAHNSRLCRCIAERLNLPAQVGDPMAGIRRAEGRSWPEQMNTREPQPAWAVAVGLSIGANLAA